jgi:putative Mg2+ transporter-C (MgtC) family protein
MEAAAWTRELSALGSVAIASGLAAFIGLEREIARKPAGLRTHLLVGASAALLIVLGETVVDRFAAAQGAAFVRSDPIRVLEAVVVGISFLGAGTIIHQGRAEVEGLTTAASILLTAAVGMAVALGRTPLAALVTAAAVAVLFGVGAIERWFAPRS